MMRIRLEGYPALNCARLVVAEVLRRLRFHKTTSKIGTCVIARVMLCSRRRAQRPKHAPDRVIRTLGINKENPRIQNNHGHSGVPVMGTCASLTRHETRNTQRVHQRDMELPDFIKEPHQASAARAPQIVPHVGTAGVRVPRVVNRPLYTSVARSAVGRAISQLANKRKREGEGVQLRCTHCGGISS